MLIVVSWWSLVMEDMTADWGECFVPLRRGALFPLVYLYLHYFAIWVLINFNYMELMFYMYYCSWLGQWTLPSFCYDPQILLSSQTKSKRQVLRNIKFLSLTRPWLCAYKNTKGLSRCWIKLTSITSYKYDSTNLRRYSQSHRTLYKPNCLCQQVVKSRSKLLQKYKWQ